MEVPRDGRRARYRCGKEVRRSQQLQDQCMQA